MTPEEKLALVMRNSEDVVTKEELLELIKTKKHPAVYLGTATTGRPHIGYFVWVLKLSDFLKAGFKVKLLLADLHAALDNTPWELLEKRYEYYNHIIPLMFESIGVDTSNFEIVKGSDFQKNKDYFYDVLRVSTFASIHDCKKAGSEVVKQSDNPRLASLIYPIMQALDEEYLDVDIQYGGVDQRKILMFAREYLPKIGYKARVEFMTPLIPGLIGEKMSASKEESKIDLLDDEQTVKSKLKKAFCPAGVVEGNGVLAFTKHVLFTIKEDANEEFIIERPEKFGGNLSFKTYLDLENAFVGNKLHPDDLKSAVAKEISLLLKPLQNKRNVLEKISAKAYPK